METKNILVLAGIKFRADEIGQELAKATSLLSNGKQSGKYVIHKLKDNITL